MGPWGPGVSSRGCKKCPVSVTHPTGRRPLPLCVQDLLFSDVSIETRSRSVEVENRFCIKGIPSGMRRTTLLVGCYGIVDAEHYIYTGFFILLVSARVKVTKQLVGSSR